MKNKNLGYLLLGGAFAYLLLQQNTRYQPPYRPQYQNLPTPPPRNQAAEYQAWINLILSTYGAVSDLWQPGGPFYNAGVDPNDYGANYTGGLPDYGNIAGRRLPQRRPADRQALRTCRHTPRTVFL